MDPETIPLKLPGLGFCVSVERCCVLKSKRERIKTEAERSTLVEEEKPLKDTVLSDGSWHNNIIVVY